MREEMQAEPAKAGGKVGGITRALNLAASWSAIQSPKPSSSASRAEPEFRSTGARLHSNGKILISYA